MADVDWYYVNVDGGQCGPADLAAFKTAFVSGVTNDSCLCWNETMAGWTALSDVPGLVAQLKPAPAPAPVVAPKPAFQPPVAPPKPAAASGGGGDLMSAIAAGVGGLRKTGGIGGGAGAAASARTFNAPSSGSTQPAAAAAPVVAARTFGAPKPAAAAAVVTATPVKAAVVNTPAAKPVAAPVAAKPKDDEGWQALQTPEGIPYYHNKITNVTSWDKPDCLKTDEEREKAGTWVWAPDPVHAFVPAKKLETYFDGRQEVEKEDGTRMTIAKNVVLEELTWSSLRRPVRDLVMLDVMNKPMILYNLKDRFAQNEIYTNVGTILISMNPYKLLPLYTPTIIQAYRSRGTKELAPHVYTIADDCYNALIDYGLSQSIVISGESGAGKTECTKTALQFLAEVAGSSSGVETRILQANPILEAFGNAKTIRNNNSSRFGKYVEVYFDKHHAICGASNTNYLLEKVRVVHQTGDERNYHIFYQLCAGASADQRKKYHLADASTFAYLNQSGNVTIDGVDDAKDFHEVDEAMDALNFKPDEKVAIWTIVAWILHVGNLKFRSIGDKKCEIENKDDLKYVATLMEVQEAALTKAITNRVMVVRGQAPMDISLSVAESVSARDALSKFAFAKLFDWLVVRINGSIGIGGGQKGKTIGILDIFGFEIFQLNSFEQLCINYANEKLQQFFNHYTFKLEETVYQQEKISFDHVSYIDNQPVLDLIEKKPSGILPSVDEELRMPNGTDKSFVDKLHQANSAVKPYGKVLSNPMNFLVRHYAGDVVYSVEAFLVKNKDRLNEDLYDLLQTSQCKFLRDLFPAEDDSNVSRKASLGVKFRTQLDDLMATLNSTQPHYIRCIKPNSKKLPMQSDSVMVLEQLTYSGVFEAITIRKQGFPFRLTHQDFMKRFKCILPKKTWPNHKQACVELIAEMGQDTKLVQMGVTKVLYRANEHKNMELKRNIAVEATVIFLQKIVRGWLARKLSKMLRKHKPLLRAAINSRDLAKLEKALTDASALKFPLREWEQAKVLKALIIEEVRVTKLLEDLVTKDPEVHFEQLSKAIAAADDCNLDNPVSKKARALLAEVVDRKKTRAWLVEGVDEADITKLDWALAKAAELNLGNAAADIAKAKAEKERIAKENKIVATLTSAIAAGGYINDGDSIDASKLQAATSEAASFGMRTKEGVRLHKQGDMFLVIRQTMSRALGTKEKPLWKMVEEGVIVAGDLYADHPEVAKAREEVSHQAAVDEVCERMQRAVEHLDQDQLAYTLTQARTLNVDVVKYPVVPVAQQYLDRMIECRRLLGEANSKVEQVALEYAIQYAESFGYDTEEVRSTRVLRDTVMQLNVEAAHAVVQLEEDPMKDILRRADAVRLTTEDIEKLRTLIFNTPEEKLVQLQLKAAIALKDPARSIRVTIRLKDLFFKKAGPMFVFDNYAKLRSRDGWADLKFVSFSREELAAGMRKHTKDPIHDPLTEITDDKQIKTVKNLFKNILGFMGDRQYTGPLLLAQELCQICLTEKWARDEIYCQIIKQLTANPNSDSLTKGWWLMAICLETFPPPPPFENYLEIFLRTKAQESQQERYVNMLHACVYQGQRASPLTESEMNQIRNGGSLRAKAFEHKEAYATPQAQLPARQAPVPIMGVVPVSAGGAGMASYNPNASATAPPQYAQPAAAAAGPPATPARPSMPPPPAAYAAPPPPVQRPPCPWSIAYHPDTNQAYYYHESTNETTWDRPADYYEN